MKRYFMYLVKKISIHHKLIYRFSVIPIKSP